MTETETLRQMLDERGVEHEDVHTDTWQGAKEWTHWKNVGGKKYSVCSTDFDGVLEVLNTSAPDGVVFLTPEQAVSYTVGDCVCCEWKDIGDCMQCSACNASYFAYMLDKNGKIPITRCPNCGRVIERVRHVCCYCGNRLGVSDRFCSKCGREVEMEGRRLWR